MKQLLYKNEECVIEEKWDGELLYLSYPKLEQTGLVEHGFSTRLGGVSEGIFESMNLSYHRGDANENVDENFRRMLQAIGAGNKQMVRSAQTHTTNVHQVTAENKYEILQDIDGLITNEKDVCLVTSYADCVPLYFVDPVHSAIGLSHSGWRGTVGKIGEVILKQMHVVYGTEAKDVIVAIGPSICQDCYEVSEDVILQFQNAFREELWNQLFYRKENGKYQLNLWKANEFILLDAGVLPEHIAVTNVCTNCNPSVLFSHRATKGQRGGMCAFLALK